MKTYDHQKYFPKVLHKNFYIDGKSKTFLFLTFPTVEYYNPRKLRTTKIKINMKKLPKVLFLGERQFSWGHFSGGQFSGGIVPGGTLSGGIFPRGIFPRTGKIWYRGTFNILTLEF